MTGNLQGGRKRRRPTEKASPRGATPPRPTGPIGLSTLLPTPVPQGPTILVVEDERIVARDLQQRLTKQGFRVPDIASSGEEAFKKAEIVKPQLVLMDIHLKGPMDGIEAARLIRDRLKIPVMFLSAYGDEGTESEARLLDPVAYLGKPVEDQQLYAALNAFFSRSSPSRKK